MITIERFVFNPFQENTYVISAPTGECIIVDAGNYSPAEDRAVVEYIRDKNLKPIMAFNTHAHVDHMLGVQHLKESFDVPFALHSDDDFLIKTAKEHGAIYGFEIDQIPEVERDIKGVERIEMGGITLEIIHTPGHTPGHVCLYERGSKSLFSGDTLFKESIGRTDLPGGDYSWIMKSIIDRILPLGPDVTFYPGHGPESTLGYEVDNNPFIAEVLRGEMNF